MLKGVKIRWIRLFLNRLKITLEEANYPQGKKKSCRQQWISYQLGVTMGPQLSHS